MSHPYRIRFVGRFVFACKGDVKSVSQVTALGMDMCYDEDLPTNRHRLFLTAQRPSVQPLGNRRADFSLFAVTEVAGVFDQLLVWDVDGYDLSVNAETGGIGLDFTKMQDLYTLSGGGTFDDRKWLDHSSPARLRLALDSGTIVADELEGQMMAFKELQEDIDPNKPLDKVVTDFVEARVTAPLNLVVTLTRRSDGRRSSIVLTPSDMEGGGPLITISNVCPAPGSPQDVEFATYYNVLTKPPQALRRQIPYTMNRDEGSRADCGKNVAIYY